MCKEQHLSWCPEQLNTLFKQYKKWAITNPQNVVEMEGIIKWGSYLLAGRFGQSSLLTEVIFACSRIFELFNDCLLKSKLPHLTLDQENRIKVLLCVLEGVEVVIEVGAMQYWGEAGKWAVVATIQIVKTIWRLVLLLRDRVKLLTTPVLLPLDRKQIDFDNNNTLTTARVGEPAIPCAATVRLPHSGCVLRPLSVTPPPHLRTFLPSPPPSHPPAQQRSTKQLWAELLHVLRPVGHLGSLYACGRDSWLPFLLALSMDGVSLHLHRGALLSPREREELARRYRSVLLYLLRCPAYQRLTEARLRAGLGTVGARVPLTKRVGEALLHYCGYWTAVYGHSWSN